MHSLFLIVTFAGLTSVSYVLGNPMPLELERPTSLASRSGFVRRDTTHCVDNESDNPIPGNLVCLSSDGSSMGCDECLGTDGGSPARRDQGALCFIINTVDNGLTTDLNATSCPGDDVPATNPDGTPGSSLGAGWMDAYCAVAGDDGLFGWLTFGVCYAYTFAQSGGDDNEAGVILLCDFFFEGLCTCITSGACDSGGGGSTKLLD